jgi:flagellar hook-associated protein 3 FlgL
MKVATNQYFRELTRLLTEQGGEVASLQARLASGEKNLLPSDDVNTAVKVLDLNALMSHHDTQQTNLKNLDSRLVQEESVMASIGSMLMRVQELAVMGANDTYSADNRRTMAAEIRGYKEQLLMLANSRSSDGSYLFAGAKSGSPPFVAAQDGTVQYQGDATRLQIQLDSGQVLEVNTTGFELFAGGSNTRNTSLDAGSAFATLENLALALESADRDGIAAQMDEIDSLRLNMELARTKIGVRRNVIEVRADILEEQKVSLTGLLSENKDLDYTQAITELSSRMLALEAAQTTMSKISQLVLFNYLR